MNVVSVFEKPIKILLLDSDQQERASLRRDLQAAHYDVIAVENEDEIPSLASTIQPDLILLSIGMSPRSRLEVLDCLRNSRGTSRIPVLFLIGDRDMEDIERGLVLGAWNYVVKPYELKELKARIRNTLILWQRQNENHRKQREYGKDLGLLLLRALEPPIFTIKGLAYSLNQKNSSSEAGIRDVHMRGILVYSENLCALIEDLKSLVGPGGSFETLDLTDTIRCHAETIGALLQQRRCRLQLKMPESDKVLIRGQKESLLLALKNMACYLFNSMVAGNTLTIEVIPMGDKVRISMAMGQIPIPEVQDATAIAEDKREKPDSEMEPGNEGFHQSIAKWVAERHFGAFGITGNPDASGSCVWMEVPLIKEITRK